MDGQTSGTTESQDNQVEVDPWIAAFAALESKSEETSEKSDEQQESKPDADPAPEGDGGQEVPDQHGTGDGTGNEQSTGGLDTPTGDDNVQGGNAFSGMLNVTEESIKQYEEKLDQDIRNRAINDVANNFIKQGVRATNGVLGATIDDADICKRDSDGVPRFYNPDTGREFTGDNPRRQAQEWVDDYNKELARVFNNTCEQYEQQLKQQSNPSLAVMKFAPTYEKLDAIRKGMLDNIIQDYEILDSDSKVIGYSCDLDKALAQVERQITMIQSYAKEHSAQGQPPATPQTPALDMKTSSGAVAGGEQAAPTSLAEAMERLQDVKLSELKK